MVSRNLRKFGVSIRGFLSQNLKVLPKIPISKNEKQCEKKWKFHFDKNKRLKFQPRNFRYEILIFGNGPNFDNKISIKAQRV